MENFPYLFAAYTIIIAIIFGYVFYLYSGLQQLKRDLTAIKETIEKKKAE